MNVIVLPSNVADPIAPSRDHGLGRGLREIHALLEDLTRHRPALYVLDLVGSAAAVWALLLTGAALRGPLSWLCAVVAAFFLYRGTLFVHEVAHRPRRGCGWLRLLYDATFGVPFMLPAFLYDSHRRHHAPATYASQADGEYVHTPGLGDRAGALVTALLTPLTLVVRFGILGPIGWLIPAVRVRVWSRLSSLNLDVEDRRQGPPNSTAARRWLLEELLCAGALSGWIVVAVSGPWGRWMAAEFAVAIAVGAVVNHFRVHVAHRYAAPAGPVSLPAQVADSLTHDRSLLGWLWAPVGLRFHALHHLCPEIPYHSLGRAHRRLLRVLPADSTYRASCRARLLGGGA